jgi:hypothetical protein
LVKNRRLSVSAEGEESGRLPPALPTPCLLFVVIYGLNLWSSVIMGLLPIHVYFVKKVTK